MKYVYGIIALTLLALGGYGFYAYRHSSLQGSPGEASKTLTVTEESPTAAGFAPATVQPANDTTPSGPLKPSRLAPQGQKEYRNGEYRFALFYPTELSVISYDEGSGASSFTFMNSDSSEGFQVFVVPYGERQVSAARFKLDEPSGVLKEPIQVVVDNSPATMFFGQNATMGETREVWFIKNGYLFEVTTYKALDQWLSEVMKSWEFI